ncbi:hypothetical protein [Pseudactinotalea sp. Z1748]|uniref:hypothetical protein n=1 Tax=Pseudactinotalea sp. Z1748 TaxID=3413027 RepID=UPI003C7BCBF7
MQTATAEQQNLAHHLTFAATSMFVEETGDIVTAAYLRFAAALTDTEEATV